MSKQVNQLDKLLSEYNIADEWTTDEPFNLLFSTNGNTLGVVKFTMGGGRNGTVLRHTSFNVGHRLPSPLTNLGDASRLDRDKVTFSSKIDPENIDIATTTHEFTHFMAVSELVQAKDASQKIKDFFNDLKVIRSEYSAELLELNRAGDAAGVVKIHLGKYAHTNLDEFLAESFTEYKLNSKPSKYAKKTGLLIDKYFKK